ncbi:MAG TPA: HNH endonuclease [Cyanobacteria bacterium UBA12227]|nr:HNH endonuclease [Cyanobacteria bacterium UBA12227]HAX88080.1 HNH endonuclease [Cyanobacteria bacterium UBA11370]HBY79342.1 HNH endonuclease [Cyanobacteria bacterium UBA11148]
MSEPQLIAKQKETVARRAGGCCEYCYSQVRFSPDPFSIEHIIPRSKGGTDHEDNLALACQGCNNRKYNHVEARDSVSGNLVSLYHPRHQQWAKHFGWNEDFTLMIGLTPTGRLQDYGLIGGGGGGIVGGCNCCITTAKLACACK